MAVVYTILSVHVHLDMLFSIQSYDTARSSVEEGEGEGEGEREEERGT